MYSNKGHSFEYINNFYKYLNDRINIHLITTFAKEFKNPNNIPTTFIDIDFSNNEAQNFNKYGPFKLYARALNKIWLTLLFYRKLIKLYKFNSGDILFLMDYELTSLPYLINKISGKNIKIFIWFHSAKFKARDVIYKIHKKFISNLFKLYIKKRISYLIVNGEYIKKLSSLYLRLPLNQIKVIQYPSELSVKKIDKSAARRALNIDEETNVILYFGMLRIDKNLDQTIESVAKAKNNPLLIIAGSEASVTKYDIENWVKKYKLKNFLLDIEYLSEEKIATYYSAADILLLTYNIDTGSQSGPLSLAREFILPAIVPDHGEIGYYIKKYGIGMTVNRSSSYEDEINKFFELSVKEKEVLNHNLHKSKEEFSWNHAANDYYQLIASVCEDF
ncbi:MAG: glycosyltransferase family 4 protein [Candidatus Cyclobacteriaceae bacterium M2_1C_046]